MKDQAEEHSPLRLMMVNSQAIRDIREQLKAIKEAINMIEFKLSQLESALRAQPELPQLPITARSVVSRLREDTPPERPSFKLKTRRSNK